MSNRFAVAIILLLLQFGSELRADDKPAVGESVSMSVNYKKSMLVVSTKDGVAAIGFDKPIANGVTYRYRFLPKGQNKEQIGEGKVFEKYKTVKYKKVWSFLIISDVENDGGILSIKVGPISLTWSHHDRGSGWIYYDSKRTRIQITDAKDFAKVDLKRFMK